MSKFFTASQIVESIAALADVHPFHGITFLACKQANLPVGKTTMFAMDTNTDSFLKKHHRLDPLSGWFFKPFKSSDIQKKWVRPDYSAKGLQAINTQTFRDAFIHPPNSRIWGWTGNYVTILESKLPKKKKIPAFHLAVWLYQRREWPNTITAGDVLATFLEEFNITPQEETVLFTTTLPNSPLVTPSFNDKIYTWTELRSLLPPAPDAAPDQGGTLSYLETTALGPAEKFVLEPADRLTLITGDNGLGKTFLLECCWWALTGTWPSHPVLPNSNLHFGNAEITFAIKGQAAKPERKTIRFDWKSLSWPVPKKRPTIPGLVVYARVDGSFAVWDPAKQSVSQPEQQAVFTSTEVWDGLPGRIEGLIRDWVRWQNSSSKSPFEIFKRVLAHLSPPDLGILEPGEPMRVPGDPRDIPTIRHTYGITPMIYSSAGVRRIVTLAYLIVWAWTEHLIAANLARTAPQRRIVILVDEMEAHLHPRWQRAVLPALMSTQEMLSPELEAQYIVATHSPLVMASSETVFTSALDSLVHLNLSGAGKVILEEVDFVKFGDISAWLTSPIFELKQARSSGAEAAIEAAKKLQNSPDISSADVRSVSERLVRYLASDDKFWPRWIFFAEQHGVIL
jgi:hypothetical protein